MDLLASLTLPLAFDPRDTNCDCCCEWSRRIWALYRWKEEKGMDWDYELVYHPPIPIDRYSTGNSSSVPLTQNTGKEESIARKSAKEIVNKDFEPFGDFMWHYVSKIKNVSYSEEDAFALARANSSVLYAKGEGLMVLPRWHSLIMDIFQMQLAFLQKDSALMVNVAIEFFKHFYCREYAILFHAFPYHSHGYKKEWKGVRSK